MTGVGIGEAFADTGLTVVVAVLAGADVAGDAAGLEVPSWVTTGVTETGTLATGAVTGGARTGRSETAGTKEVLAKGVVTEGEGAVLVVTVLLAPGPEAKRLGLEVTSPEGVFIGTFAGFVPTFEPVFGLALGVTATRRAASAWLVTTVEPERTISAHISSLAVEPLLALVWFVAFMRLLSP
jgi:hypothetical protein